MFGRRAGADLRLSGCNISPDHAQVVAGRFERLFGIMVRNEPGVIIKGYIAFPAETIKDDQQPSMFLVDARPHEIDDGDVVPRLASCTKSAAEHEPQGSFELTTTGAGSSAARCCSKATAIKSWKRPVGTKD